MFKKEGLDAVILKHNIDQPFISSLEQAKEGVKFRRIDTDLADIFKEEPSEEETKALEEDTTKLTDIFKKALSRGNTDCKG